MLNRTSKIVICSRFVNCKLWSCDMNSTLGSVVPLAMFNWLTPQTAARRRFNSFFWLWIGVCRTSDTFPQPLSKTCWLPPPSAQWLLAILQKIYFWCSRSLILTSVDRFVNVFPIFWILLPPSQVPSKFQVTFISSQHNFRFMLSKFWIYFIIKAEHTFFRFFPGE